MAEMGYVGLSEQWALKRAGDLHWRLIARAMGQAEAVFTCAEGRPLYAAFCASRLTLGDPAAPRLGGGLELRARLYRVGRSRLGSLTELRVEGRVVGEIALVSVFVGRSGEGAMVRRAPRVLAMPAAVSPALEALAGTAARAAGRARRWPATAPGWGFTPTPAVDFNAAGLLYFPGFSALSDRAVAAAGLARAEPLRARTVAYLGNVAPGEPVTVQPLARRDGHLSLIRGGDDRLLAVLRARY
ncbi:MAG: hypothetical protein DI556_17870 [Rhodovulum sulfidophilum]|uniref:Uncharacterized protein n=1 Tax=Rhodovulum sulfidophilum TaxID=35806 RepID=A0A2W5N1T1_RHOSU|nr:MAG: hypothetical protein DI556_17870 [Rhodovulum sulfidophilum]